MLPTWISQSHVIKTTVTNTTSIITERYTRDQIVTQKSKSKRTYTHATQPCQSTHPKDNYRNSTVLSQYNPPVISLSQISSNALYSQQRLLSYTQNIRHQNRQNVKRGIKRRQTNYKYQNKNHHPARSIIGSRQQKERTPLTVSQNNKVLELIQKFPFTLPHQIIRECIESNFLSFVDNKYRRQSYKKYHNIDRYAVQAMICINLNLQHLSISQSSIGYNTEDMNNNLFATSTNITDSPYPMLLNRDFIPTDFSDKDNFNNTDLGQIVGLFMWYFSQTTSQSILENMEYAKSFMVLFLNNILSLYPKIGSNVSFGDVEGKVVKNTHNIHLCRKILHFVIQKSPELALQQDLLPLWGELLAHCNDSDGYLTWTQFISGIEYNVIDSGEVSSETITPSLTSSISDQETAIHKFTVLCGLENENSPSYLSVQQLLLNLYNPIIISPSSASSPQILKQILPFITPFSSISSHISNNILSQTRCFIQGAKRSKSTILLRSLYQYLADINISGSVDITDSTSVSILQDYYKSVAEVGSGLLLLGDSISGLIIFQRVLDNIQQEIDTLSSKTPSSTVQSSVEMYELAKTLVFDTYLTNIQYLFTVYSHCSTVDPITRSPDTTARDLQRDIILPSIESAPKSLEYFYENSHLYDESALSELFSRHITQSNPPDISSIISLTKDEETMLNSLENNSINITGQLLLSKIAHPHINVPRIVNIFFQLLTLSSKNKIAHTEETFTKVITSLALSGWSNISHLMIKYATTHTFSQIKRQADSSGGSEIEVKKLHVWLQTLVSPLNILPSLSTDSLLITPGVHADMINQEQEYKKEQQLQEQKRDQTEIDEKDTTISNIGQVENVASHTVNIPSYPTLGTSHQEREEKFTTIREIQSSPVSLLSYRYSYAHSLNYLSMFHTYKSPDILHQDSSIYQQKLMKKNKHAGDAVTVSEQKEQIPLLGVTNRRMFYEINKKRRRIQFQQIQQWTSKVADLHEFHPETISAEEYAETSGMGILMNSNSPCCIMSPESLEFLRLPEYALYTGAGASTAIIGSQLPILYTTFSSVLSSYGSSASSIAYARLATIAIQSALSSLSEYHAQNSYISNEFVSINAIYSDIAFTSSKRIAEHLLHIYDDFGQMVCTDEQNTMFESLLCSTIFNTTENYPTKYYMSKIHMNRATRVTQAESETGADSDVDYSRQSHQLHQPVDYYEQIISDSMYKIKQELENGTIQHGIPTYSLTSTASTIRDNLGDPWNPYHLKTDMSVQRPSEKASKNISLTFDRDMNIIRDENTNIISLFPPENPQQLLQAETEYEYKRTLLADYQYQFDFIELLLKNFPDNIAAQISSDKLDNLSFQKLLQHLNIVYNAYYGSNTDFESLNTTTTSTTVTPTSTYHKDAGTTLLSRTTAELTDSLNTISTSLRDVQSGNAHSVDISSGTFKAFDTTVQKSAFEVLKTHYTASLQLELTSRLFSDLYNSTLSFVKQNMKFLEQHQSEQSQSQYQAMKFQFGDNFLPKFSEALLILDTRYHQSITYRSPLLLNSIQLSKMPIVRKMVKPVEHSRLAKEKRLVEMSSTLSHMINCIRRYEVYSYDSKIIAAKAYLHIVHDIYPVDTEVATNVAAPIQSTHHIAPFVKHSMPNRQNLRYIIDSLISIDAYETATNIGLSALLAERVSSTLDTYSSSVTLINHQMNLLSRNVIGSDPIISTTTNPVPRREVSLLTHISRKFGHHGRPDAILHFIRRAFDHGILHHTGSINNIHGCFTAFDALPNRIAVNILSEILQKMAIAYPPSVFPNRTGFDHNTTSRTINSIDNSNQLFNPNALDLQFGLGFGLETEPMTNLENLIASTNDTTNNDIESMDDNDDDTNSGAVLSDFAYFSEGSSSTEDSPNNMLHTLVHANNQLNNIENNMNGYSDTNAYCLLSKTSQARPKETGSYPPTYSKTSIDTAPNQRIVANIPQNVITSLIKVLGSSGCLQESLELFLYVLDRKQFLNILNTAVENQQDDHILREHQVKFETVQTILDTLYKSTTNSVSTLIPALQYTPNSKVKINDNFIYYDNISNIIPPTSVTSATPDKGTVAEVANAQLKQLKYNQSVSKSTLQNAIDEDDDDDEYISQSKKIIQKKSSHHIHTASQAPTQVYTPSRFILHFSDTFKDYSINNIDIQTIQSLFITLSNYIDDSSPLSRVIAASVFTPESLERTIVDKRNNELNMGSLNLAPIIANFMGIRFIYDTPMNSLYMNARTAREVNSLSHHRSNLAVHLDEYEKLYYNVECLPTFTIPKLTHIFPTELDQVQTLQVACLRAFDTMGPLRANRKYDMDRVKFAGLLEYKIRKSEEYAKASRENKAKVKRVLSTDKNLWPELSDEFITYQQSYEELFSFENFNGPFWIGY